jgi:hypothetical protein
MAFNFPNSPTDGQIYTDATSGAQYIYKSANGAWMQSSAAQIKLVGADPQSNRHRRSDQPGTMQIRLTSYRATLARMAGM